MNFQPASFQFSAAEQNNNVKWPESPWNQFRRWEKGLCWKESVKEPSLKHRM